MSADDIEKALEQARAALAVSDPAAPSARPVLIAAVDALAAARPSGRSGDPGWVQATWLEAFIRLYLLLTHHGGDDDRDGSIVLFTEVLLFVSDGDETEARTRLLLGLGHGLRVLPREVLGARPGAFDIARIQEAFARQAEPGPRERTDLAEAIRHLSYADSSAETHPEIKPAVRMVLAALLMMRGMRENALPDLMRGVTLLTGVLPHLGSILPGAGSREMSALGNTLLGMIPAEILRRNRELPPAQRLALTEEVLDALTTARTALGDSVFGALIAAEIASARALKAELTGDATVLTAALDEARASVLLFETEGAGLHRDLHDGALHTLAGTLTARAAHALDPGLVAELLALADRIADHTDSADSAALARARYLQGMAMSLDALLREDAAGHTAAIVRLAEAVRVVPDDDDLALTMIGTLGAVLFDRSGRFGDLAHENTADLYFSRLVEITSVGSGTAGLDEAAVIGIGGQVRVTHAWRHRDQDTLASVAAELRLLVQRIPKNVFWALRVRSAFGTALMAHGALAGDRADMAEGADLLAEVARTAQRNPAAAGPEASALLARGGAALVALALLDRDEAPLVEGIGLLERAAVFPDGASDRERGRLAWAIGTARLARHLLAPGGHSESRDRAILDLERARDLLEGISGEPVKAAVLTALAERYAEVGDHGRAVETGLAALHARADDVLLQPDPASALLVARGAAETALAMTGWCREADLTDKAFTALELGRALVQDAAVRTWALPTRLRELGEPGLAAEWEADLGGPAATPELPDLSSLFLLAHPPGDLRGRTLTALTANEPRTAAPSRAETAAALSSLGHHALVYLIPGRALLTWDDGARAAVELPGADDRLEELLERLAGHRSALDGLTMNDPERDAVLAARDKVIDELCDWAGPVIAPVRAAAGLRAARPRLVLVACGRLGLVPWHAAKVEGRPLLADTVVSVVSSARALVETASRRPLPLAERPIFLSNPSGDLFWTQRAVKGLLDAFYPDAVVYGRPRASSAGRGTAGELLDALPGGRAASLLHIGSHARAERPVVDSYLVVADDRLRVAAILEQARRRPTDPRGGLAVLAVCSGDLTEEDHDEALTPATALLTAGLATVIAARWEVRDLRTALLTAVLHDFLRQGERPADALRLAQLWMLDPMRRAPESLPEMLAAEAAEPGLADTGSWAGFTHQGW